MKHVLRSPLMLGLALTLFGFAPLACDTTGSEDSADASTTGTTGDGDGDGDATGDGDPTGGECFPQPPLCEQFVRCIGALVPSQAEAVADQYGPEGSCWCGTEAEAQTCYETCFEQIETALSNPDTQTESQCHESVCGIDELDPTQPYGPVDGDSCGPYTSEQDEQIDQVAFNNPLNVPGSFCAPKCSGLANFCPDHPQTTADGSCYILSGDDSYCVSRCWVDPTIVGGTQCPCGATCQPQGAPDGEGNMRGLCTFE